MTTPRIAIVAGASRGIGRATAARFVARGWRVIGVGRGAPPPDAPAGVAWVRADFASTGWSARCADDIAGLLDGRHADAFVHCAALHREGTQLSANACELLARVNLVAPYVLSEALRPHLADPSTIVLVSSIAAERAAPGTEFYGATKAGVEALVRSLAFRFGTAGIRVVGIAPGLVRTDMSAAVYADAARVDDLARANPSRRNGEPADIADAIYALTEPALRWVTGVVVRADGGSTLGFGQPAWTGLAPAPGFARRPPSPSTSRHRDPEELEP